jgi:hypothetical protein
VGAIRCLDSEKVLVVNDGRPNPSMPLKKQKATTKIASLLFPVINFIVLSLRLIKTT